MRLPQTRREKEIWHACETLWQQPPHLRKLTGDAIQAQLLALNYKKGSPNEVYRYRKTWQETRGVPSVTEQINDNTETLSPPKLPDPINRAVSLVRDEIFSEAQQTIQKMTEDFNAERTLYEEKIKAVQALLEDTQQHNQQLHLEQQRLEGVSHDQKAQNHSLLAEIETLKQQNLNLEKQASKHQHQYALALEKIEQGEKQLTLLADASVKELESLKKTLLDQQEKMVKQLEQQHTAQIVQYREAQSALRDLMEAQRHQWMQQLDAEKTAHKKLQVEHLRISQLLERANVELTAMQEKHIQYETLIEIQQLQNNLLSTLTEEVHHLEKNIALDKITALFEHKTKGIAHQMEEALKMHFEQQNEWLMTLMKRSTETTEPSA